MGLSVNFWEFFIQIFWNRGKHSCVYEITCNKPVYSDFITLSFWSLLLVIPVIPVLVDLIKSIVSGNAGSGKNAVPLKFAKNAVSTFRIHLLFLETNLKIDSRS